MKKTLVLATFTAIGLGMSAPAFAQGAASYEPIPDVSVTAERLPPSAPVAVSGTVGGTKNGNLIVNSMSGSVEVAVANKRMTTSTGTTTSLARYIGMGGSVTAFGALRHGDMTAVQPQAILLHTGPDRAELILTTQPKLQSAQKLNKPINERATLRALQNMHTEL